MQIRIGTSGYSYKEWKGTFYPDDLPASKMLGYYAERFDTVEINNTFYRMPKTSVLESWKAETPDGFRFVLKASQRITHRKDIEESKSAAEYFFRTAATLGEKLGPVLVQLPPWAKRSDERLETILATVPDGISVAIEFRHESWNDPEVHAILRRHDAALCVSDTEDLAAPAPIVATASRGYLRLRRCDYDQAVLAAWRDRIEREAWDEAWVFFKHEDEGKGPDFAAMFRDTPTP